MALDSPGDGPSKGAMDDLKNSLYRTLVSSNYGDRGRSSDRMRPMTRHQNPLRLGLRSGAYGMKEGNSVQ